MSSRVPLVSQEQGAADGARRLAAFRPRHLLNLFLYTYVCVSVRVHMCMLVHMFLSMCMYGVYMCMPVHMPLCVCIYENARVYAGAHAPVCVCVYLWGANVYTEAHAPVCVYMYGVYICIQSLVHLCMCMYGVHMCVKVPVHMWKTEDSPKYHSSDPTHHFVFETGFLTWVLGIELRSSGSHSEQFVSCNISPAHSEPFTSLFSPGIL